MKVFFDTNILIDAAIRIDRFPDSYKLINDLLETSNFSLWVSAISINNVDYIVSKLDSRKKARVWLYLIREEFSIIPFRKSNFVHAIGHEDGDFEDQIQIASAEEFHMDYIITRNVAHFSESRVPVVTPTQFLEKWNDGEFEPVADVPFLDLKAQHHQVYNEIDDRITDVIANTEFILGKHVDEFEERFAELQGAKYCIGVSSGTDALHVALLALGIGHGDRVIVPLNTFIATAEAVSLCGAEPVFVDCDNFYNLDVQKIRDLLNNSGIEGFRDSGIEDLRARNKEQITNNESRITCILPVHLYGQPANMDEIMALADEYGLKVVEDCCQAHLAARRMAQGAWHNVGNFGEFGAFSFYPGKNLGAYGEAGALITNDEELYLKTKMVRQHGEIERNHHKVIGHNYRMEALQGAVLSTKLNYLEEWTEKRRTNAGLYSELLRDVGGVEIPLEIDKAHCVYHLYVIQTDDRDDLQKHLQEKGIASGLHYPVPLHLQEAYGFMGHKEGDFPVAEKAAKRILSLPMYPELTEGQIQYVVDKIKEFLGIN